MKIREGTTAEVDKMFRTVWEPLGWYQEVLSIDRIIPCDMIRVAEVDGKAVGVIAINTQRPELTTLFVLPEYERRGIGRALCEHSIPRVAGDKLIYCDVTTEAMHKTIQGLSATLQARLDARLSYEKVGDEYASWREYIADRLSGDKLDDE